MERKHKEHACGCDGNLPTPSVHQTLEELDFSRGIWSAALDGDLDEVRTCLEKKSIPVNATDSSGYTALHYASRNGHVAVCKLLLHHHASPNIQTRSGGVTALHRAAYSGHVAIARMLLDHGADPALADSDNKLPLHKATERDHAELIEMLVIAAPSSKNHRDNRGRLPLDCVTNSSSRLSTLLQVDGSSEYQTNDAVDTG